MTAITINLDPVALREATTQSIMGMLTPEVRAKIISDAISALLNPSTNSWDKGRSPIQQAFDNAVARVAHEVAHEHVKNDPTIKSRLEFLVKETATNVLRMDAAKMAENMASAFVESMRSSRD